MASHGDCKKMRTDAISVQPTNNAVDENLSS